MTASTPRRMVPLGDDFPEPHMAAEASTEVGAEPAVQSMKHYRISATAVVCVLLASPFLGAIGWAVAARLFTSN